MKKIISLILLIIWCLIIFGFSNANGEESGSLSDKIIRKVAVFITNIDENSEEMNQIVNKYSFIVRKLAHISEYFILSFLFINFLYNWNINKHIYLYTIIFCFTFALTDEFHQTFINERSGNIIDTFIDLSGSIFNILLIKLYKYVRNK